MYQLEKSVKNSPSPSVYASWWDVCSRVPGCTFDCPQSESSRLQQTEALLQRLHVFAETFQQTLRPLRCTSVAQIMYLRCMFVDFMPRCSWNCSIMDAASSAAATCRTNLNARRCIFTLGATMSSRLKSSRGSGLL